MCLYPWARAAVGLRVIARKCGKEGIGTNATVLWRRWGRLTRHWGEEETELQLTQIPVGEGDSERYHPAPLRRHR